MMIDSPCVLPGVTLRRVELVIPDHPPATPLSLLLCKVYEVWPGGHLSAQLQLFHWLSSFSEEAVFDFLPYLSKTSRCVFGKKLVYVDSILIGGVQV